jgi:pimeloyl-ACP methyl ester carboxylesterase
MNPTIRPPLAHRVDGDGPPLVLLNGGLMSIGAWQPIVPALTAHHRVVRCDFRGQLLSPGPYAESFDEHARDVVELLDDLGIERAHVAGVSFGAEVAMMLAASYPERVERLTVITATERTTDAMRADARDGRQIAERVAAGEGDGKELFRRILTATWSDWWLAQQPAGFMEQRLNQVAMLPPSFFAGAASILALLDTLDLTPHLGRITAPALVIGGEHDRVFPPEHSRAIAAAIPNARLVIEPNTGHGLLFECGGRVVELLLR